MDINSLISTIWDSVSPFVSRTVEAGAITAGAVEAGKVLAPSLVAGKEGDRSFQFSFIGAILAKVLGATTLGWVPLLATAAIAPFVSQGIHDVAAPYADKLTKPVAGTAFKPITAIVERFLAPFAKALGVSQ